MEQYYIVMLAFLAVIAVIDLFVGVSNDACNFLNSALGCRIASFRTTMWVASLGVLLGATFSSGMMEVARSGIFHPQMFSFSEIMVVFFAVMVADVILLDAFNSLGLPPPPLFPSSLSFSAAPPLQLLGNCSMPDSPWEISTPTSIRASPSELFQAFSSRLLLPLFPAP